MQDTGSQADFDYMRLMKVPQVDGVQSLPLNDYVQMKWVNDEIRKIWKTNYIVNKPKIKPVERSLKAGIKCCILVGSSPAIKKQIPLLKNLSDNFLIISSNGAYEYLVKNGVEPDYVVLIEGRNHVVRDICTKSDATLIVSPFVDPLVYDLWDGPIETYMCSGGEDFDKTLHEDFKGVSDIDVGGGNVINASFLYTYKYLSCRNYIAIGTSLCYYDNYYVDGRSTKHVMDNLEQNEHIKAVDIYGEEVRTTAPLLLYKTWMETYSRVAKVDLINATEDGILGVYLEPIEKKQDIISFKVKYLPWISIAPLSMAIGAFNNKLEDFKNVVTN